MAVAQGSVDFMDADDFDLLRVNSTKWGEWAAQPHQTWRWEVYRTGKPYVYGEKPSFEWKYAYWFDGDNYAGVILARFFLASAGYPSQTITDLRDFDPEIPPKPKWWQFWKRQEKPEYGKTMWVLLTDFPSSWEEVVSNGAQQ